jgi:hypothetical protein
MPQNKDTSNSKRGMVLVNLQTSFQKEKQQEKLTN